jgi:hypothetical protein
MMAAQGQVPSLPVGAGIKRSLSADKTLQYFSGDGENLSGLLSSLSYYTAEFSPDSEVDEVFFDFVGKESGNYADILDDWSIELNEKIQGENEPLLRKKKIVVPTLSHGPPLKSEAALLSREKISHESIPSTMLIVPTLQNTAINGKILIDRAAECIPSNESSMGDLRAYRAEKRKRLLPYQYRKEVAIPLYREKRKRRKKPGIMYATRQSACIARVRTAKGTFISHPKC